MNITIISVGKLKEKYLKQAIDEYSKRLTRYCKIDSIELPDEKVPENLNANIINKIKEIYKNYFNIDSILLEHGSTENGRHPQSIVHAHLHLIPFNFNKEIEDELFTELHLKQIESFESIKINEKLDYWLYCDQKGKYYTESNILDAPRSIFMNLIAKQINLPLPYEWRKSVTKKEYIDEMINIFNDNKKLLKNI